MFSMWNSGVGGGDRGRKEDKLRKILQSKKMKESEYEFFFRKRGETS